jgi:hypothetical protein
MDSPGICQGKVNYMSDDKMMEQARIRPPNITKAYNETYAKK